MLNFLARNIDSLLATYGYLAVFVFVGIESLGIPVPGETMLVTAAIYAGTTGRLSIFWVIVASSTGAIKVVFFGRFVSVLRIFAAFLAGVNHMHWRRFLIFNALGGIIWSTLYGVAAYLLGQQLLRLSGRVDTALAIVGVIVIIAVVVFLRRNEARLQREADAAMPGPLEASR